MSNNLHIVPHDGEWAIRLAGTKDPLTHHGTQQEAIEAAMDLADEDEYDIVVHRQNGSFRNVIRYEAIERRLAHAAASRRLHERPLFWGGVAAGVLVGIGTYLVLNPPRELRKWID